MKNYANILDGLNLESRPCFYCDVRIEDTVRTRILYQNGDLQSAEVHPAIGAFLRVFEKGYWFTCSTTSLDRLGRRLDDLIEEAHAFSNTAQSDGVLKRFGTSLKKAHNKAIRYESSKVSEVPLAEKRQNCEKYLRVFESAPKLSAHDLIYGDQYKMKYFASSRGVQYEYDYQEAGFRAEVTFRDGEQIFKDVPIHFSDTYAGTLGQELFFKSELEECESFLRAPLIDPGPYRVVLGSRAVGVFAHESFGHKSEADFMMGDDHALSEWRIGAKVGSEVLSIVDSGDHPGTSGYCPWDDEGTPMKRNYLIKNGILKGRLHSLSTAMELDEEVTGNGRALNFEFEPIVRMTSTYVEPGPNSFEELLDKAGTGIYVKDIRYGTGMSRFTIAPSRSYRIRNGKLAEPVRINVLSGSVFETLGLVEACSKDFQMWSYAFGGCGKGEQWPLPVSYGGPSILVSRMDVG